MPTWVVRSLLYNIPSRVLILHLAVPHVVINRYSTTNNSVGASRISITSYWQFGAKWTSCCAHWSSRQSRSYCFNRELFGVFMQSLLFVHIHFGNLICRVRSDKLYIIIPLYTRLDKSSTIFSYHRIAFYVERHPCRILILNLLTRISPTC